MSASFFDVMKYAKTGIASPEMTGFDKVRARAAFGGYPVSTITGTPPISFKADGKPLTSWTIAGNMVQTGTPTPDAPIMPQECGDRTANLFDISTVKHCVFIRAGNTSETRPLGEESENSGYDSSDYIAVNASTQYTVKYPAYYAAAGAGLVYFDAEKNALSGVTLITQGGDTYTFTTPANCAFVRFSWYNINGDACMLTAGSTAQTTYIPYGFQIPLSLSATPIYLTEPIRRIGDYADSVSSDGTVTRKIDKLVLTGEENWATSTIGVHNGFLTYAPHTQIGTINGVCSHYKVEYSNNDNTLYFIQNPANGRFIIFDDRFSSAYDFKAFLAAQYAAGTPVCVWYVLATPVTETITAPTLTTAKGSNTLTVGTELQPSAVSVTGNIKAI